MPKDSCVFYRSFYEAIQGIPESEQLKLYNGIFEYMFNDKEILKETGVAKSMFTLIKPNVDSAVKRYNASVENGKKGGRPKKKETQEKPKQNPKKTQEKPSSKPKQNLNDNVDDNVDDNVNNKNTPPYGEVIEFLNKTIQSKYKSTTKKSQECIRARWNEGFTVEDFKKVINIKHKEWNNTDMQKFLRPETLFGNKFESYLNQKELVSKGKMSANDIMSNNYDFDEIERLNYEYNIKQLNKEE